MKHPTGSLTKVQLDALFNILTHAETYAEIEAFKYPDTIRQYGYPFATPPPGSRGSSSSSKSSGGAGNEDANRDNDQDNLGGDAAVTLPSPSSPLLQTLLIRLVLPLPGLRELPSEFWDVRVQGILAKLAEEDLSESYDKGAIGTRKILATGASALVEMFARGCLGGYPQKPVMGSTERDGRDKNSNSTENNNKKTDDQEGAMNGSADSNVNNSKDAHDQEGASHDNNNGNSNGKSNGNSNGNGNDNSNGNGTSNTEHRGLEDVWEEFIQQLVHGNLIDELQKWLTETEDLEGYSETVKGAADYAIINLASLLHHVFAVTPEGQYVLRLVQNSHRLIPYSVIRQILRLGNAATMLNSLVKLLLAKLSLGSLSNWTGLTSKADEGMNLLQRIISAVLFWDSSEFKKTADKIEKSKVAPSSKHLRVIRKHALGTKAQRLELRERSIQTSKSVIMCILEDADPKLAATLTEGEHHECHQYYAAYLSTRDRDAIVSTLCKQTPDLLTQAVRDVMAVYEPMIRDVHNNVNLAEHLDATKAFLEDMLAVSSSKKVDGSGKNGNDPVYILPTVEDFVDLLHRHKGSVYKWMHHICSKCPSVRDAVVEWALGVAKAFRPEGSPATRDGSTLLERVSGLFAALPGEQQDAFRSILDQHAVYLDSVRDITRGRVQTIFDKSDSSTARGPGMYLTSWHSLIDEAAISPDFRGKERRGTDVINRITPGKPSSSGETTWDGNVDLSRAMEELEIGEKLRPNTKPVVEALGEPFRGLLREVAERVAGEAQMDKGREATAF